MAKITIYVPDDRMAEIEAAKEQGVNLSQLFMSAFDRSVSQRNSTTKLKDKEMKVLVQRLRVAKEADYERGWIEGVKSATCEANKNMRYSDFIGIVDGSITFNRNNNAKNWVLNSFYNLDPKIEKYEQDDWRWENHLEETGVDMPIYRDGFNAGFTEQIKNIWEQIREELA